MTEPLTKRKQQARETRKKILESAKRLFHEHGFEMVKIEDITQDAGVARGSFYTYFKSKSDIIVSEFRTIDNYYKQYAPNLKRYKASCKKLTAFTRAQMRYVRDVTGNEHLKVFYANQAFEPGTDNIINDRSSYWHHLICSIMREGQEAGEIRTDVPAEQLTLWFNRSIRGVFFDWCISSGEEFDLVKEGVRFCEEWLVPSLSPKQSGQ